VCYERYRKKWIQKKEAGETSTGGEKKTKVVASNTEELDRMVKVIKDWKAGWVQTVVEGQEIPSSFNQFFLQNNLASGNLAVIVLSSGIHALLNTQTHRVESFTYVNASMHRNAIPLEIIGKNDAEGTTHLHFPFVSAGVGIHNTPGVWTIVS
jgi:hypothetical protein